MRYTIRITGRRSDSAHVLVETGNENSFKPLAGALVAVLVSPIPLAVSQTPIIIASAIAGIVGRFKNTHARVTDNLTEAFYQSDMLITIDPRTLHIHVCTTYGWRVEQCFEGDLSDFPAWAIDYCHEQEKKALVGKTIMFKYMGGSEPGQERMVVVDRFGMDGDKEHLFGVDIVRRVQAATTGDVDRGYRRYDTELIQGQITVLPVKCPTVPALMSA